MRKVRRLAIIRSIQRDNDQNISRRIVSKKLSHYEFQKKISLKNEWREKKAFSMGQKENV